MRNNNNTHDKANLEAVLWDQDQEILFQLGKPLARRLLFKAPRAKHDTHTNGDEGWGY